MREEFYLQQTTVHVQDGTINRSIYQRLNIFTRFKDQIVIQICIKLHIRRIPGLSAPLIINVLWQTFFLYCEAGYRGIRSARITKTSEKRVIGITRRSRLLFTASLSLSIRAEPSRIHLPACYYSIGRLDVSRLRVNLRCAVLHITSSHLHKFTYFA